MSTIVMLIQREAGSYTRKRIVERGVRDARPSKIAKAPADLSGAELELYWETIVAAGGKRPASKQAEQAARRATMIAEAAKNTGPYQLLRANGKPTPAELLRAALCDRDGKLMIEQVKAAIDARLEAQPDAKVGVQMAFEVVRWNGDRAGMPGAYKVDNDAASAVARWLIACWPEQYKGRIELRGEGQSATSWPWLNVMRPWEPCWTSAAGSPMPARMTSIFY